MKNNPSQIKKESWGNYHSGEKIRFENGEVAAAVMARSMQAGDVFALRGTGLDGRCVSSRARLVPAGITTLTRASAAVFLIS